MKARGWVRALTVLAAVAAIASIPAAAEDNLAPPEAALTLVRGGSQTIEKTLHLDALPQKADVVIAIDTTGSMGPAIAEAKADATSIVNSVQAQIPEARFAVVDFKDYPVTPFGGEGDFPYLLRRGLTANAGEVQAAIDLMGASGGGDLPESHNRVFFETYSDPNLAYDVQAARILIVLTDAIPHDAAQSSAFPACANTPPTDLGRDGAVGGGDDLGTRTVLDGLIANHTTMSAITYSADASVNACLAALAEATGGRQVPRGDTASLLALIQSLVTDQARRIREITFRVEPEAYASWVGFTPPTPYGPFTAPRDIPFDETITVPASAALGPHTFAVTAIVDGAERATQSVSVNVVQQAIGGLQVQVDRGSVPVGIAAFSPSAVPPARVPFFAGATTASMPVGSVPVGSVPVGSVPVGSVPVGSVPVGSVPVGSVPVGSVGLLSLPVGSVPVGSVPVGSVPVGSVGLDRILLSALPLDPASNQTWAGILLGTPLAGRPLQTLTLLDVAKDAMAGARFNQLQLKHVPFFSSLLRNVKLASILLGNATLAQLPVPAGASTWAAALTAGGGSATGVDPATNTVLGVDIAGQLGSTPVGSVPVGSVPVGSVPVGSVPVGSVDLLRTRLAAVLVSALGANLAAVVDCSGGFCSATRTLGEAQTAGRILATATVADLDPVLDTYQITLAELIAAFLGLENYPWHTIPLGGLQDVAGTGVNPRYTVDFDLDCALSSSVATLTLALPPGFLPVSGSARWSFGTAAPATGTDATATRTGFAWAPPASVCGASTVTRHVTFNVDAFAGLELGDFTAGATVRAASGASSSVAGQAPIAVGQNHEPNEGAATTPIVKNKVLVFHVASAGDTEVFSLPVPARNTRSKVLLKVPDGSDLDLVIGKPATAALNSAPVGSVPIGSVPVGSVPVPDEGATTDDASRSPQPETLQDIPVGSVPVGSVSASRGSADEAVQVVSDGSAGSYTVTVSGYNGSHSTQPAALYVTETPPPPQPPCNPRAFANSSGAIGTLPASLPPGTRTLFLVNRNQLSRLHGEAAVDALLAYVGDQVTPGTLAARPEVRGAVLQLDGAAAVRNAYAAWNAAPCSVQAANDVVRANTAVVGSYLASLPDLQYVVLVGSDEAVPSGRVPDPVLISPELDNASDLAFTTAGLTNGNALYASAATNQMLTDAAYGAFTTIPWRGRQLNLPQVAVSRLLESPAEIQGQLAQYQAANGLLSPSTAYVTGYDFLTDGAEAVRDGLARPGLATTLQTSPQWSRTDIESEFFSAAAPAGIGSLNAHYNHYLAQPAGAATAADLFSTASVPPTLPGRVLFTMGCHGGLNVADSLFASGLGPAALDWAQRYAQAQVGLYVANYTFGYGDSEAVALSERLMALFASRLGRDDRSLAAQWVDSLHTYFATAGTAYGDYDEKAMIGANLMGPPWYRVSGAPAPTAPVATPTTPTGDGLTVASIAATPASTQVGPGGGGGPTYWRGQETLAVHYRPLQPVSSVQLVPAAGTPPARGIFITGLTTHDVTDIKPVLAYPTIDLEAHEPKANFDETFFPANYVLLTQTGGQARATIAGGQFRPTPGSSSGTQRLVDSIAFQVAFAPGSDATAPQISQVGATVTSPTSVRVFVRASDTSGIRQAAALVNDGSASWRFVPLANQGGGLFTADVSGLATTDVEIIAEVQDVVGNTGYSTKKGENFNPIIDTQGPELLVDVPQPDDIFLLNQVVPPRFACSDPGGVASCAGQPLDTSTVGPHTYTVVGTDLAGASTPEAVPYAVHFAYDGFKQPVENDKTNAAKAGSTIPLKWQLRDAAGAYQRDLNAVTSITSRTIKCPAAAVDPLPNTVVESSAALSYDLTGEQYVFTWKTQKAWAGTCRSAYLALSDGTVHSATFTFK